nr:transmembrane protein [Tanacetum cinerariifolium]
MDIEDEEWVNIPYDGLLEVVDDDGANIFSRKYVKSPGNLYKSGYFSTPHEAQNLVQDEPISDDQKEDVKEMIKLPILINESRESRSCEPDPDLELDQDPVFQVFFPKESKFVEMKMDSNLSHIETSAFQYEEKSVDQVMNCSSPSKMIKKKTVTWEESNTNNKLNLLKWGLSGIGAFCSVGMAAVTICIIICGNGRRHKQNQKLTIQIYPDNKRIKQVVQNANEAMSAFRGVPLVKAQITYGGHYESVLDQIGI